MKINIHLAVFKHKFRFVSLYQASITLNMADIFGIYDP